MENFEKFILQPSLRLFAGLEVKEDTEFVTDNDSKTVHQEFKNGQLKTTIDHEYETGYHTKEHTELIQDVPAGAILLWSEETGYIIPDHNVVRPSKAIEDIKVLEEG